MRYIFILLSVLLLSSCASLDFKLRTLNTVGMYDGIYYNNNRRVKEVLGVTQEGDTIQVPIDYFGDRTQRTYDFNLEYFFWRNNWHPYNPNIYNRRWFVNNWWWNPYTPWIYPTYIYRPNNIWTPRTQQPRRVYVPRHVEPRGVESPIRGRSNQTISQPQYNRPRTTTRPSTPTRQSVPTRSNSNSRTTSGGRVIKQ